MVWPWNRKQISEIWTWPHISWLNIFGWWAEEASSNALQKWLAKYRTLVLIYLSIFHCTVVFTIFSQMGDGGIHNYMFTVFASSPGLVGMAKMYCVVIYRKPLKAAMQCIDEMILKVGGPAEEILVKQGLKRCWTVFFATLVAWLAMTVHWLVRPLIAALLYSQKTRILNTWPVFIDTWTQFCISYCYQCPIIICVGITYCMYDSMFLCIAECILCHFDVLRHRLSILRLERHGASDGLLDCIEYNAKILRTCEYLRQSSTVIIIFQVFYMVITLCTGIFLITIVRLEND